MDEQRWRTLGEETLCSSCMKFSTIQYLLDDTMIRLKCDNCRDSWFVAGEDCVQLVRI